MLQIIEPAAENVRNNQPPKPKKTVHQLRIKKAAANCPVAQDEPAKIRSTPLEHFPPLGLLSAGSCAVP